MKLPSSRRSQIRHLSLDSFVSSGCSFINATTLIGPEGFVKERLSALQESGVSTLNVALTGDDLEGRVKTLDKLRNLVEQIA